MKAKFEGKCRECGGVIYAGDEIRWSRAEGARHEQTVCDDYFVLGAEQAAELRFELGCAAHMAGTSYVIREQGWGAL